MSDNDLAFDAFTAMRFVTADLCDVAAQRTALLLRVGDSWSTTAHRLRDDSAVWELHDHTKEWMIYSDAVGQPLGRFAEALGGVTLVQHLGLHRLVTDLREGASYTLDTIAVILGYVVTPALCTWTCSALATTQATWSPERDSVLAAEAASSDIGASMAAAANRVGFSPGGISGPAPLIGATLLALRRMLDHPEDGALLANIDLEISSILARLGDAA